MRRLGDGWPGAHPDSLKFHRFLQEALKAMKGLVFIGCFLLFLNRGLSFICIFKRLLWLIGDD